MSHPNPHPNYGPCDAMAEHGCSMCAEIVAASEARLAVANDPRHVIPCDSCGHAMEIPCELDVKLAATEARLAALEAALRRVMRHDHDDSNVYSDAQRLLDDAASPALAVQRLAVAVAEAALAHRRADRDSYNASQVWAAFHIALDAYEDAAAARAQREEDGT